MPTLEKRPSMPPDEGEEIAGELLAKCERVIATLGEDGVKPFSPVEFKKVRDKLGASSDHIRKKVFTPVLLGPRVLNWLDVDKVELAMLKGMIPREETVVFSHLESLVNMGAKTIDRSVLMQASWDHACIEKIEDDAVKERFLATRLKTFDDYISRKVYAFSLGLMEFKEKTIAMRCTE